MKFHTLAALSLLFAGTALAEEPAAAPPASAAEAAPAAAAPPAAAASKQISATGQFRFVSDAPMEKIFGTVDGVTGAITTDPSDLSKTTGTFTVPVPALKTGNAMRDEHMLGPDWLDKAKFPTITFVVKSVKVVSDDKGSPVRAAKLEATGDFTLHGVTVALTAPVDIKWKDDKVKVTTEFDIKLADYKVAGKDGVIGSKVGETIKISGSLQGAAK